MLQRNVSVLFVTVMTSDVSNYLIISLLCLVKYCSDLMIISFQKDCDIDKQEPESHLFCSVSIQKYFSVPIVIYLGLTEKRVKSLLRLNVIIYILTFLRKWVLY